MPEHTIWRDGSLFDKMDPATHAIKQIAASYSDDMHGSVFEVRDENGESYYSAGPVTVHHAKPKVPKN